MKSAIVDELTFPRFGGALLAAATGWAVDRLGLVANPFTGVEDAVIAHPWSVVTALAVIAAGTTVLDRRRTADTPATMSPTLV